MTSSAEPLSDEEAEALGIRTHHERMPNGELRFRLRSSDGTAYIRTQSVPGSGWQRSHYHNAVLETYIVQKGRMVLVEWRDNKAIFMEFSVRSPIVTTQPGIAHNVYLFSDSVIHTVKHGPSEGHSDWHSYPHLDTLTLNLTEDEIEQKLIEHARSVLLR